jgi:hypothetical protein
VYNDRLPPLHLLTPQLREEIARANQKEPNHALAIGTIEQAE